jgi:hypothetical protein
MYCALRKWQNDIKMNLKETECECVDIAGVAKDSVVVASFRKRSYRASYPIKEGICWPAERLSAFMNDSA